jgi:hypothetical protein
MKFSKVLSGLCFIIFLTAACKKTGTTENPQPVTDNLTGTWHVKNYVVANLTNGQPNDTLLATHNEVFTFTNDSLFTDSWLTVDNDRTVTPPLFEVTGTTEYKNAYAYTRNNSQYTTKSSSLTETVYIINLTATKLTTDEKADPSSGFKDVYVNFEK